MMTSPSNKLNGKGARAARAALAAMAGLLAFGSLSGCVVVGASSRGGFFVWPGGVGLVVLILLVLLVLRRR